MRELLLLAIASTAMSRDVEPDEALAIARRVVDEHPNPTEDELLTILARVRDEASAAVWGQASPIAVRS